MEAQETATLTEAAAPQPILVVEQAAKALGGQAARIEVMAGVSFAVREGEFVSVVGPSGCGKTTLLMCLAGLYAIDSGSIQFSGDAVAGPRPASWSCFRTTAARSCRGRAISTMSASGCAGSPI